MTMEISTTNRIVTYLRICIVSMRRTRVRRMGRRIRAQTAMTVCKSYSVLFCCCISICRLGELLNDTAAGEEDTLQVHLELLRCVGELEGGFFRDVAVLRQFEEALVEGHHAFFFTAGDGLRDFFKLVVENQFSDDGVVDENFVDWHDAFADGAWGEALTDDGLQTFGNALADGIALLQREHVQNTADTLRGVFRMERRENQVAGFGGGESRFERLAVSHFTDQDDVGVLSEGMDKSGVEA